MRKKGLKRRIKEVHEFFFNLMVAIAMLSMAAFLTAITLKLLGWV